MTRFILIVMIMVNLTFSPSAAAPSTFVATWIAGPSSGNGVETATDPGSRLGHAIAFDPNRNCIYLFGGSVWNGAQLAVDSALWMFNMTSFQWHLKQPSQNQVLGTFRIADAANHPGQRGDHCLVYDSGSDRLWLFGGNPADNRLWSMDLETGWWTWQAGDNNPSQGTPGVPADTNEPTARHSMWMRYEPYQNRLILSGADVGAYELWTYDIKDAYGSGNWTYWKGSNAGPVKGTQGVEAAANWPFQVRRPGASVVSEEGLIWQFGGNMDPVRPSAVWRLNVNSLNWAWMTGNADINPQTTATAQGQLHSGGNTSVTPGSRATGGILVPFKTSQNAHQLLFYGGVEDSGVWSYDTHSGIWTWQGGIKTANRGQLRITSLDTWPEARFASMAFDASSNRVIIFGGGSQSAIWNDVWTIRPMCTMPNQYVASLIECLPCPGNTATAPGVQNTTAGVEACTHCAAGGFVREGSQCLCPAGQTCVVCPSNCRACNADARCTQCENGYEINAMGACVPKPGGGSGLVPDDTIALLIGVVAGVIVFAIGLFFFVRRRQRKGVTTNRHLEVVVRNVPGQGQL